MEKKKKKKKNDNRLINLTSFVWNSISGPRRRSEIRGAIVDAHIDYRSSGKNSAWSDAGRSFASGA